MHPEAKLWNIVILMCYLSTQGVFCVHNGSSIECYLCAHDPSPGMVLQEACGTHFRSSVIQTQICHGACAKTYSEDRYGISIFRACYPSPPVTKDMCVDIGFQSTKICYCFSNLCNKGRKMTSPMYVTSYAAVFMAILYRLLTHM